MKQEENFKMLYGNVRGIIFVLTYSLKFLFLFLLGLPLYYCIYMDIIFDCLFVRYLNNWTSCSKLYDFTQVKCWLYFNLIEKYGLSLCINFSCIWTQLNIRSLGTEVKSEAPFGFLISASRILVTLGIFNTWPIFISDGTACQNGLLYFIFIS